MTATITADNLLLWPKLDSNGGYDVVVKGASVIVSKNAGRLMEAVVLFIEA